MGDKGVKVILSGQPEAHSYQEAIDRTDLEMDDLYSDIAANNSNVTLVDAMSGFLNQKDLMDDSRFHLNSDEAKSAYLNKFADAYKGLNATGEAAVDNKLAATAPTGIATLAPTIALASTTAAPTTATATTPTTADNTVKYHDGTTYNATELSTLTNQIIGLTDALGTGKSWVGDALKAGDNANIGFDAATGKKILGTDTITNKQQVALDMAANLNNAGIKSLTEIGMGDIKGDVSAKADIDEKKI